VDTSIDTLEARGLVAVAAYRPELEYLFRHWLVQDAAYGSLLKQERRELHRLVGEALESLYPDRRRELAGILAMHFEQAGDASRAVEYLITDGRYALERAAIHEAYASFDRASQLLSDPAAKREDDARAARTRIEVGILRARAGLAFRPSAEIVADLEAIAPAAEELGDLELVAQVYLYQAVAHFEGGDAIDDPVVSRSIARLEELGRILDDPSLAALPLAMTGLGRVFTGPIREGVEALETAIPLMEGRRDFIGAAFSRGWLAMGYAALGEFDRAMDAARAAEKEAADGDLIAQLDAQIATAVVRSLRGELDEAAPLARACVERSEETGATACAVVSSWVLGDVLQRQRRLGDAMEALRLGLALSPGASLGMWSTTLQVWLRSTEEATGDAASGPDDWDALLAEARSRRNRVGEAGVLWKRAEARAARGEPAAALDDFTASAAIYEEQGARPNLARVWRGWGEALLAAGRTEEATDRLVRAQALFESMGLRREADEVRAEVPASADGDWVARRAPRQG
jgi:tetratricopeptide (TPR) repeat protein